MAPKVKKMQAKKQRRKFGGIRKWDDGQVAKDAVSIACVDIYSISGTDLDKCQMLLTG